MTGPGSKTNRFERLQAQRPWHFLYFLPLPHQHGSFRPNLVPAGTGAFAPPPLGLADRGAEAGGLTRAGGGGGSLVICTRYMFDAMSNWMSLSSSWKA